MSVLLNIFIEYQTSMSINATNFTSIEETISSVDVKVVWFQLPGSGGSEDFKAEVVWLEPPSHKLFNELDETFFKRNGHANSRGSMSGVVLAIQQKPFSVCLMDQIGQCFIVDLKTVCCICRHFIKAGVQSNFIVFTNCSRTVQPSKNIYRSETSSSTEIHLIPSTQTRILCPVVPYNLPVPGCGLAPVIAFELPFEIVPYFLKKVGAQRVKTRTFKLQNAVIQIFGDYLNDAAEKLKGEKCLLTSCSITGVPNTDCVKIMTTRSSILAKATSPHFRLRMIPVL